MPAQPRTAWEQGRRELPRPAYDAIVNSFTAVERDLETMASEDSLWFGPGGGR